MIHWFWEIFNKIFHEDLFGLDQNVNVADGHVARVYKLKLYIYGTLTKSSYSQ